MTAITSWKDETLKVYFIYKKSNGEVWSVSTDKEARDYEFKQLQEAFPKVKLGKLAKVVKRKDLFRRINQSRIK